MWMGQYTVSMARPITLIDLTDGERHELQRRVKAHTVAQRDSRRAAIVLRRSQGLKQAQVATQLGVSKACVNKWSQRFEREGLAGLQDRPGRGRPPSIPAHKVAQVMTRATQPPAPRQRWSVRSMARAVGISPDSVRRIWRANDLKPHRLETFKLSTDQRFEEKFWDIMGLSLSSGPTTSSRIGSRPLSFPLISDLRRSFGISWGCPSPPRRKPRCCAATKRVSVRLWSAPSRACLWAWGRSAPGRMMTHATALSPCVRR